MKVDVNEAYSRSIDILKEFEVNCSKGIQGLVFEIRFIMEREGRRLDEIKSKGDKQVCEEADDIYRKLLVLTSNKVCAIADMQIELQKTSMGFFSEIINVCQGVDLSYDAYEEVNSKMKKYCSDAVRKIFNYNPITYQDMKTIKERVDVLYKKVCS